MPTEENAETTTAPAAASRAEATIPKARFDQVIQRRRAAEARVLELEAKIDGLSAQATAAATLEARVAELSGTLEAERSTREQERGLAGLGLHDPEGQDVARLLHARAKSEASLVEWLTAQAAKPDEASRALRPYLPTASGTPAPKGTEPAPERPRAAVSGKLARGLPDSSGTRQAPPGPSNGAYTSGQIGGMTSAEYLASRDAILAQFGRKR